MKGHAQAAIEFITTYGWAFLVMMLAIVVANSFGVFNAGSVMPDRCTANTDFRCGDFRIFYNTHDEQAFDLFVSNRIGATVDELWLVGASIEGKSLTDSDISCLISKRESSTWQSVDIGESISELEWFSGRDIQLGCNFEEGSIYDLVPGSRGVIALDFEYLESRGQFPSSFSVRMVGEVKE